MKIKIKPLSVNQAFRSVGNKTVKSAPYRAFEQELWYLLPNDNISQGKLFLAITFGVSSKLNDLDNLLKPTIDILQKKYTFNDKMIYRIDAYKEDVKKGEEYIDFKLKDII